MERLTYFDNGKWRIKIGDTEYSGEAVDRLSAYEDTGLEPEKIELLAKKRDLYVDACGELPLKRIRELAQADREGRCVVLPEGGCEDKDGENALKSAMNTCFYHNNPVTRFIADAVAEKLTRQEAQAALRREQDEQIKP